MTDTKNQALIDAEQVLEQFLKDNPHMIEQQKELDKYLNNCRSPYDRMVLLRELMRFNLEQLNEKWNELIMEINKQKEPKNG